MGKLIICLVKGNLLGKKIIGLQAHENYLGIFIHISIAAFTKLIKVLGLWA